MKKIYAHKKIDLPFKINRPVTPEGSIIYLKLLSSMNKAQKIFEPKKNIILAKR